MKFRSVLVGGIMVALVLTTLVLLPAQAQEGDDEALPAETIQLMHEVRLASAQYHDLDTALEDGYGKFLECFTYGERGMGQHYVQGDLAGDDVLDPARPEALVYEPLGDGRQILVAYEYLVFADVWDPDDEGREPPSLYGQDFVLKTNIPETPPVWTLHIWLWSHNPDGLFADYNPIVACPADAPVIDMSSS